MGIPARGSAVTIKRPEEIASMRRAGAILVDVLEALERVLRPGITTAALDHIAEEIIIDAGAVPSFKGYGTNPPFPASICASVNDEVVHGIPSPRRLLNEGDIVGLDVGCIWQGWHADCARTWPVGRVPRRTQELIDATRRGMEAGIAMAVPGNRLGDIGAAIEAVAHEHGLGIVRPLVGMASVAPCTRRRRCQTTAGPAPGCGSRRGCASPSSRCSTSAGTASTSSTTIGRSRPLIGACRRTSKTRSPWPTAGRRS